MCGIAGILNFDNRSVAHSQIQRMTDVIQHRGPDGEGQYIDGCLGLGHRRLAIIDLSTAGHQPMQTKDGRYTITYNGEVYNFKELRTELESLGYRFHSNTDTEVVLYAYAEWGPECLNKFNGMFAFALWDKKENKIFIARDRYGIKPLYYHITHKHFIFASEIKALIESGLYEAKLDKEALVEYLTFQNFFTDGTLFKDVKLLMPGYFGFVHATGKLELHQYWDFNFCGSLSITQDEAIEETSRLFNQAVQRQLISDVPINAYLSGGIDSGAITMIATQLLPHLRTFTIGFDLNSASGLELSFDERAQAEYLSYLAGTEHYEMVLKAGDMQRCMDKYIWHLEEPRVGQSYPNYYAAKLASKFGKVVLSGAGGDELFGGYPWRYFYSDDSMTFNDFIDRYYLKWQRLIPNNQQQKLFEPIWDEVKHIWTRDIFENVLHKYKTNETISMEDYINKSLYLEAKTFLHGLLVVEDKLSMAHSLETRVPFLDNDLVDFAMKIPSTMKVVNKRTEVNENDLASKATATLSGKHILRQTLNKYMKNEHAQAKKQGFSSPDASWFRGESIEYVKRELQNSPKIFNSEIIESILEQHISAKQNHRLTIWSLLYIKNIIERYNLL